MRRKYYCLKIIRNGRDTDAAQLERNTLKREKLLGSQGIYEISAQEVDTLVRSMEWDCDMLCEAFSYCNRLNAL